ncbi:DUF2608 domain-containing protein [Candidatus Babeliales bacterium]|nr:DUF2608 domain-containing protein [Candidatus Babeliales bacterium]MCF7899508.1 DUF2608 domain-containing protein [Candidatus Babeliales bacterium]
MNKHIKYFLNFIFAFFLIFQIAYASNYQVSYNIKDAEKYIKKDNLFVFDIDQTILDSYIKNSANQELEVNLNKIIEFMTNLALKRYESEILQNVYARNVSTSEKKFILKKLKRYIKKRVEDKVFDPVGQIYSTVFVKPVEKETIDLINKLKNLNIKTLIFTARPWKSRQITLKQLNSLGIDITKNCIYDKAVINRRDKKELKFGYTNGVLFSMPSIFSDDKVNKGKILIAFFNQIDYKPAGKVVFIDDKKHNISSVIKNFKKNNIEFEAIWYKTCTAYLNFTLDNYTLKFLDSVWGKNWKYIDLNINSVVDYILGKLNINLRYKNLCLSKSSNSIYL